MFGDDFGFDEEAEPVVGFACFLDVYSDRCSRAKELICKGSGNSRLVFKLFAELYDPNCKIE